MPRVHIRQTLLVILLLVCGQVLVSFLDFRWVDSVTVFELLSVKTIVLGEVDVHETC